jgi:hypothetical protein
MKLTSSRHELRNWSNSWRRQQERDRLFESLTVTSLPTEQFKFRFGVLERSQLAETNSDDCKAIENAAAAIAEFVREHPIGDATKS